MNMNMSDYNCTGIIFSKRETGEPRPSVTYTISVESKPELGLMSGIHTLLFSGPSGASYV